MIGYSPLLVRRCWRSTRAAKKAGPTPPATTDSRRPPPAGSGYVLYTTRVLGSVVAIQPGTVGDPLTEWRYAPGETDFDTPTVVDGDAYIPGDRLHALSAATGEVRWTAPVRSTAGVSTDGDRLYLPIDDGALVALDTADGTERWRVSLCLRGGRLPPDSPARDRTVCHRHY